MITHSSTLAWKIPWTEEPGGLQSMGHKELYMIEHAYMQQVVIQLFCFIQKFPKIIIFLMKGLKNHITFIPLGIQINVKREKKLALEQEAHLASIIWGILKRAKLSPILSWNYTMNITLYNVMKTDINIY